MWKGRYTKIISAFALALAIFIIVRSVYITVTTFAPDFSVMWNGANSLLKGNNPYIEPGQFTGIGYPPNSLLFYFPLLLLPYNIAQAIFVTLSAITIPVAMHILFKIIGSKNLNLVYSSLTFLLIVFSFPTRFTLGMGQNNLIAFLLLLLSYYLYKTKQVNLSGIILGLAISFKTIFLFFILFYFLKKEWRLAIMSLATFFVFVLLTSILFGTDLYLYYFKNVIPPLLSFSGREIYYNQGYMGFISRLTLDVNLRSVINTIISLMTVLYTSYITTKKSIYSNYKDLTFSLYIISLLLLDTLSWQHHFVWLMFPFVILFHSIRKLGLYVPYFIWFVAYLLVSWNFKNPILFFEFPKTLVLSNTFYGAILLISLNFYLLNRKN